MNSEFWDYLQTLVNTSHIVLDRPKGSTHPRFVHQAYPVSYGYLEGTTSIDSGGVDIWVGTLCDGKVVGVLCTVDLLKKDTELKIIYDCTDEEIQSILDFINYDQMRAVYLKREE